MAKSQPRIFPGYFLSHSLKAGFLIFYIRPDRDLCQAFPASIHPHLKKGKHGLILQLACLCGISKGINTLVPEPEALCEAKETRGEKEEPLVTLVANRTSTLDLACVSGSMLEIEPATEVNMKWIYAYESYAKYSVLVIVLLTALICLCCL
jgi:hypothetical protein